MAITAVRRTVDQVENLPVRPKRNGLLNTFLTALQSQVDGQEDDGDDEDATEPPKFQVDTWRHALYYPSSVFLIFFCFYNTFREW